MTQQFTVSKIEAARRQLETAIRLDFSDGDPISVHTLTAAAYNVLRGVTAQTGIHPMILRGKMLEYVRAPYERMMNAELNAAAEDFFKQADQSDRTTLDFNLDAMELMIMDACFKHDDQDDSTALDFNAATTELMIMDACAQCTKLDGKEPPLFITYRIWFTANHPDVFILSDEFKEALQANADSIVEMGSGQYFSTRLPLISKMLDKR